VVGSNGQLLCSGDSSFGNGVLDNEDAVAVERTSDGVVLLATDAGAGDVGVVVYDEACQEREQALIPASSSAPSPEQPNLAQGNGDLLLAWTEGAPTACSAGPCSASASDGDGERGASLRIDATQYAPRSGRRGRALSSTGGAAPARARLRRGDARQTAGGHRRISLALARAFKVTAPSLKLRRPEQVR
jgi:hypothetical protein